MKKFHGITTIILALIPAIMFSLFHCSEPKSDNLLVAVTILPQQEFVEKIAGEQSLEIMVLIPPGASPATYELTPAQMQKLSGADIYFALGSGLPFENTWLDKIAALNRKMKIVDCSEGIRILTGAAHRHGVEQEQGRDPHIWCSPLNAKTMIRTMTRGLAEINPGKKELYESNAESYLNELEKLHEELANRFSSLAGKTFVIFHPAWEYFARDYGLNQVAIEVEGKEPHAVELKELVKLAEKENIKTIFASPQFNTASAEMIAASINGRVEFIDPLARNYVVNLLEVAVKLSAAME